MVKFVAENSDHNQTFYFLAEEENVCIRRKIETVSVNSMNYDLDANFS